ncbi:patatin-like phospholipase family protein [Flavobacterium sp. MFBS3-15]|uniref:patatin-like phospholipase family protein n=1 Tax=Flavobacterium sp. MFBS3-15 TaxID=2989816 RepID=UPI002236A604|nr:patatin-like phospholipase family protein [Flavobacterium sp. MFBS3-15]MCW4467787.1 patatin-like phospholipase family protein [Flavobacterium sp. MFBS3-15]
MGKLMFAGGLYRLCRRFGWYRGDAFTHWVEKIIAAKTGNSDITFRQLGKKGFKQLYVTGTCLNRQKLVVFSAETYPDMKVKDAVRISMSVPLYFEAVFIDSKGTVYKNPKKQKGLDIVVDGGITGNFPIFLFDSISTDASGKEVRLPNPKTIGVRIDSDAQIANDNSNGELAEIDIDNLSDYMQAFYILTLENLNRNQLVPEDWDRTISVSDAGIGPKVKKMSEKQKQSLIKSGETSAALFLGKTK